MRILAIEIEKSKDPSDFEPHLTNEAQEVWRLYQRGIIREAYFRADRTTAVLVLECASVNEATEYLARLPLVAAGLIEFDVIPLAAYTGFSRLFA